MQQQSAMEEIQERRQLPGVRFCPMDDELVLSYLKPLLAGENVPGLNDVVFDCDLYGRQEPWQIWDVYKTRRAQDLRKSKDLYFFTKVKKLKSTNKRISRTVGNNGTWKGDNRGEAVTCVETGREVGIKKRFTYKNQDSAHNGCWTMYEYDLASSEIAYKKRKNKDYVLCLLRKTSEPKNVANKRKHAEKKRVRRNEEEETSDEEDEEDQEEEVLEVEAKRQRTTEPCSEAFAVQPLEELIPMPVEDDFLLMSEAELNAFTAQLEEELLPSTQDGNYLTYPISEDEVHAFAAEVGEILPGFEAEWVDTVNSIDFSVEENKDYGNEYEMLC